MEHGENSTTIGLRLILHKLFRNIAMKKFLSAVSALIITHHSSHSVCRGGSSPVQGKDYRAFIEKEQIKGY
jgi:hypothetical protein